MSQFLHFCKVWRLSFQKMPQACFKSTWSWFLTCVKINKNLQKSRFFWFLQIFPKIHPTSIEHRFRTKGRKNNLRPVLESSWFIFWSLIIFFRVFMPFCNQNGKITLWCYFRTSETELPFWLQKGMKNTKFGINKMFASKYTSWAFKIRSQNVFTMSGHDFMLI